MPQVTCPQRSRDQPVGHRASMRLAETFPRRLWNFSDRRCKGPNDLDADLLPGKHVTQVDVAALEADPAAMRHDDAPIVERILELLEAPIRAVRGDRGRGRRWPSASRRALRIPETPVRTPERRKASRVLSRASHPCDGPTCGLKTTLRATESAVAFHP